MISIDLNQEVVFFLKFLETLYYALLNANELWRTTALIYVNARQYYKVSQRASGQGSYAKPHATGVPNS